MEFLVILIISIILSIISALIFGINLKKLKTMTNITELDEMVKKYPSNTDICKEYLKKLNNESVKMEENKDSDTTIYVATSNKIFLGDFKNSYIRILTIAHECLHSIQNKKMLLFNFIFSNIYLIYYIIIIICALFKKLSYEMTFLSLFCILGLIYYSIRAYLENDAMIKSRYLAKEYMEEKQISTPEEIQKLLKQYDETYDLGIKATNYQLLAGILAKIIIFSLICLIR